MAEGRMLYGIAPGKVTKTIVGTDTTAFSGTSAALLNTLQLSFFKPN